jgi:hypothetical protein
VLRVPPAHVLYDVSPAAGPEAREVRRRLDWPTGRRRDRENERHLSVRNAGMLREAEQSLSANFHRWTRRR